MKLLLAEDEAAMSEALADILTYHNYMVDAVSDGEAALWYAKDGAYDGIILDIMMPGKDGLEVLERLRREGNRTPVLLLTAKSEVESRILGLNLGADDYLTKPFAMGEFLARVRAMLRRREAYTPDILTYGNFSLDRNTCLLQREGKDISMSRLEFRLMELLMLNPGVYFSAEKILERVWGYDTEAQVGTVGVYISYLRRKLSDLGADAKIVSRRNIGYALEAEV